MQYHLMAPNANDFSSNKRAKREIENLLDMIQSHQDLKKIKEKRKTITCREDYIFIWAM